MKKHTLFLFIVFLTSILNAQVTEIQEELKIAKTDSVDGWKKGGIINMNLSQTSLTNWAAGGQNSVSISELFNVYARYKKGKNILHTDLDISYGVLKQGENNDWWKTDDKIDFTSKYGRKAYKNFYYTVLVNFRTQFAPGYNYPNDSVKISDFMAPGYLYGAIGMDYKLTDELTAFIAPATSKFTFVHDQFLADAGAFGVEPAKYDSSGIKVTDGRRNRAEFGGYTRFMYKKDIMKNITAQTKLELFSNYLKNPQNIDVNWETLLSMKVNKFISATIATQLIYDDDIKIVIDKNNDGVIDEKGPRIQFKEVLGVGFSYKF
jgi:hypothetical protein